MADEYPCALRKQKLTLGLPCAVNTPWLSVPSLHCERSPISTQPTIELVPSRVAEGESVLLVVHNLPENLRAFFWYKRANVFKNLEIARHIIATNSTVLGPVHSGREIVYSNGSLLLHNVTWNDTGFYTLRTLSTDMNDELAHVKLQLDTCRLPPITAQFSIEAMPPNVVEGESALLLPRNIPKNLRAFSWYKGVIIVSRHEIAWKEIITKKTLLGPAHSGREIVYFNGTLVLQNTTQNDAGYYTLITLNAQLETQETHVYLHIYKPVTQPIIRVTSTTVTAQSSVVLTCLPGDTGVSIRWIFNNRSLQLTERMTLSPTKCQLSIDPVRIEDAGDYQCEVFNPVSSKTSLPVSLVVRNA
ncbi:carcinoembryonic antigen-related cell adhesion molecule 3-like isoform X2 [Cricetulus griseus]|uniref:Carcinoembryonic antigen-related cell adhesion molecule 3-like isoform X2 n=2 Tax=Cricetulus griseus TaxID=10029 RepID=A0A9J7HF47_CRIGR|nr:carcinoembryonic antigen-related cell adhesion molecule 3-like isoform X2 [Cricetulus griseus]